MIRWPRFYGIVLRKSARTAALVMVRRQVFAEWSNQIPGLDSGWYDEDEQLLAWTCAQTQTEFQAELAVLARMGLVRGEDFVSTIAPTRQVVPAVVWLQSDSATGQLSLAAPNSQLPAPLPDAAPRAVRRPLPTLTGRGWLRALAGRPGQRLPAVPGVTPLLLGSGLGGVVASHFVLSTSTFGGCGLLVGGLGLCVAGVMTSG